MIYLRLLNQLLGTSRPAEDQSVGLYYGSASNRLYSNQDRELVLTGSQHNTYP